MCMKPKKKRKKRKMRYFVKEMLMIISTIVGAIAFIVGCFTWFAANLMRT